MKGGEEVKGEGGEEVKGEESSIHLVVPALHEVLVLPLEGAGVVPLHRGGKEREVEQ